MSTKDKFIVELSIQIHNNRGCKFDYRLTKECVDAAKKKVKAAKKRVKK